MNPSRTQLAEQLFEQSLELPEAQRKTWLQNQCGADEELYSDVCELCALQMESSDLFASDAPIELLSSSNSSTAGKSLPLSSGSVIGDFQIDREIGSGGMGIVFRAKQVSLKRTVALKVLLPQAVQSPSLRKRFQIEVEAAARLQHPNIVGVLTAGSDDDLLYYAMDYVEGQSLAELILQLQETPVNELEACQGVGSTDRTRTKVLADTIPQGQPENNAKTVVQHEESGQPLEWQTNLQLASGYFDWIAKRISEVAAGVQFAHSNNVLHRDIKPSNLLLSEQGTAHVGDFGLARNLSEPGITQTGEIIGTPYYMAPEQVQTGGVVSQSVDIYAIGATLYEALTLQPPFPGENRDQVLASILHDEIKPPRNINPRIPIDLETICLKALEKRPEERYASAVELEADLQRFLRREPILARRASVVDRSMKWIDRHRALAASMAALPVCVAIVATIFAIRNHRLANELRDETRRANVSVLEARTEQARAILGTSQPNRRSDALTSIANALEVLETLDLPRQERQAHRSKLRNEAVAALAVPELSESRVWNVEPPWTSEVEFSQDYQIYAQPSRNGPIRICQVDTPGQQLLLSGPTLPARQMKFSPDGRFLVSKHYSRGPRNTATIYLWDLSQAAESESALLELPNRFIFLFDFDFSCTGSLFATVNPGVGVELYDLEKAELLTTIPREFPRSAVLAFSANNHLAMAPFREREFEIWQIDPAPKLLSTRAAENGISAITWSRTQGELAIGTTNGEVQLWKEQQSRPPRILRPHNSEIVNVHFQPYGTLLATRTLNEQVAISDTASLVSNPITHSNERVHLSAMGFSDSGEKLAYCRPKEFGYFEVANSVQTTLSSDGQSKPVQEVRFHPAHTSLLARSVKDSIEFWDTNAYKLVGRIAADMYMQIQFSHDGAHIYAASLHKGVARWPIQVTVDLYGNPQVSAGERQQVYSSACIKSRVSSDGRLLAVMSSADDTPSWTIRLVDVDTRNIIHEFPFQNKPQFLRFTENNNQFSAAANGKQIRSWDITSGKLTTEQYGTVPDDQWDFCETKELFAKSSSDSVQFIDIKTNLPLRSIEMETRRWRRVRFSPDGTLAVTTSKFSDPLLLEVETGQILATLKSQSLNGTAFYEFSPDGAVLAIAGLRDVHLWRIAELHQQLEPRGLAW